ncbi:MAG: helix-turn-helix domain-containing protein [Bacteroidetes bacterium]|nr:MAG: helix-turn-helix domain-containing protein [Bacteroidota bacterium]
MERTYHIKHMVCPRCIEAVRDTFTGLGAEVLDVSLGKAQVEIPEGQLTDAMIAEALASRGFELLQEEEAQIISQVKTLIVRQIHHQEGPLAVKNSVYLAEATGIPYPRLSRLFSSREGLTIERFTILQRIERVKEWLSYGEWTLPEMAERLGYSSGQHLSGQFKAVTGMTVTQFRQLRDQPRRGLDEI